jgi:hypothetical protein
MGLLFKVNGVKPTSPAYRLLTVAMLMLCIVFIISWLLVVFFETARKLVPALVVKLTTSTKRPLITSFRGRVVRRVAHCFVGAIETSHLEARALRAQSTSRPGSDDVLLTDVWDDPSLGGRTRKGPTYSEGSSRPRKRSNFRATKPKHPDAAASSVRCDALIDLSVKASTAWDQASPHALDGSTASHAGIKTQASDHEVHSSDGKSFLTENPLRTTRRPAPRAGCGATDTDSEVRAVDRVQPGQGLGLGSLAAHAPTSNPAVARRHRVDLARTTSRVLGGVQAQATTVNGIT